MSKNKIIFADYNYGIRELTYTIFNYDSGESKITDFVLMENIGLHKTGIQFFELDDKKFLIISGKTKEGNSFTD